MELLFEFLNASGTVFMVELFPGGRKKRVREGEHLSDCALSASETKSEIVNTLAPRLGLGANINAPLMRICLTRLCLVF
ncbi:hypothetical protein JXA02_12135, partial [candidate division KSB1 bacterium]|nr:hypothetical protein [candidate division KSB1 bacterium]